MKVALWCKVKNIPVLSFILCEAIDKSIPITLSYLTPTPTSNQQLLSNADWTYNSLLLIKVEIELVNQYHCQNYARFYSRNGEIKSK